MRSLGIIGGGILGKAIARGFMEHCDCRVFDIIQEKSTHYDLADVATCDIVMIALPTPALPNGRCNTLAVDDFLRTAQHEGWWTPDSCYVIRSTVPVGYTQSQAELRYFKLPLLHSPEFLTARCSIVDFQTPARNIVGVPVNKNFAGAEECPAWQEFDGARQRLTDLYKNRFPGVGLHLMPSNASELVKLSCNTFFAAKVTLFNLFAETARAAGVDWEEVRAGILSDGRIAHAHTQINFPPGYGGTCLPKDLADLYHCADGMGVDARILFEIHCRNESIRRQHDDDLAMIDLPGPANS